jgi:hypothetical protein
MTSFAKNENLGRDLFCKEYFIFRLIRKNPYNERKRKRVVLALKVSIRWFACKKFTRTKKGTAGDEFQNGFLASN